MENDLLSQLQPMRRFFESGATQSYAFRKEQLQQLKRAVTANEKEIYAALYADLKKSPEECWVTENGFFLSELDHAIGSLKSWMEPEAKTTNLLNLPGNSRVVKEPLGVVLIIAPWNYPFQLLLTPLIGAIAAGNCVVLKPSEFAPATAALMQRLIETAFPKEYILYIQGDGATVIPDMMKNFTFDHVFYTGSTAVGRHIYQLAAERLVPVTLELGGKSPCVVEADANISVAARRIAMTSFSNAGQMCVAPDYVLVHSSVKEKLVAELKKSIVRFYGDTPENSSEFGRMINEKQFNRVAAYINQGNLLHGGRTDITKLFIEPTLIDQVELSAPVMQEEIFGPVLPILAFNSMEEAQEIIARNPNPLAFYVFTSSRQKEKEWLNRIPSGGVCINNASLHLTNHNLPFGGRGFSGTGQYHGKYSFDTFSHRKAVMRSPTWFDPGLKYPPFKGKLWLLKKMV
ncbi:aldehyde dehydrogenase [Sediminibacterium ginsengisoli]|uniref:Aldehyde dehydrogenase n=1 Tax=Sediminibacterium ginsengisoli TaxID=413434 RepID=A0A1T4RG08_9BACT|nr:aldehyde dehydrogenase [Sediminibacterium ginsengisoli]SKA14932.1 aldehyde dehydrogenase (NAD+) [Sediminibacterium ginsengisoli]